MYRIICLTICCSALYRIVSRGILSCGIVQCISILIVVVFVYSLQIQKSLHTASECRNRYIEPPMQESLHRAPNAGIPTYGDTRLPYGETRGSRTEKPRAPVRRHPAPVRRNPGLPTQESLHTVSKCMNRYIQSPNA